MTRARWDGLCRHSLRVSLARGGSLPGLSVNRGACSLFGMQDDQSGDEVDGDRLFEHVDNQDPRRDREEPAILVHLFPVDGVSASVQWLRTCKRGAPTAEILASRARRP